MERTDSRACTQRYIYGCMVPAESYKKVYFLLLEETAAYRIQGNAICSTSIRQTRASSPTSTIRRSRRAPDYLGRVFFYPFGCKGLFSCYSFHPVGTTVMMDLFVKDARHIYLACGATDFRKQSAELAAIVTMQFELAKLKVKQIIQQVAKCTKCGKEGSENPRDHFQKAAVPSPILPYST